jgi:hypothetical protein
MIYTILEETTGKELFAKFDDSVEAGQVAVTELRTEEMDNPYFDFTTRTFYDKID